MRIASGFARGGSTSHQPSLRRRCGRDQRGFARLCMPPVSQAGGEIAGRIRGGFPQACAVFVQSGRQLASTNHRRHRSAMTTEPYRPRRSVLYVPASNDKALAKIAQLSCDAVIIDLEDAVAPDDKEQARRNIIAAIGDIDWGRKQLSVRINGLDTHYMYRDVVDVLENCSDRLDLIMIPKVGCAADVYAVDALVTAVERAK
eukprot:gene3145-4280_t